MNRGKIRRKETTMLKNAVAALEIWDIKRFCSWLTAGYKDLAHLDTHTRAFEPLHLLVGHGDVTNELKSIYDALSDRAQMLFRNGLANAIAALPAEADFVPVFRALLHLAGRIKALEALPIILHIGSDFFGMPDRNEGRELFALAIDIVAGMAPASGTSDALRSLTDSAFFRPEYAPLVLIALCRSEPNRLVDHLALLRNYFAALHAIKGAGNAAMTARRVVHYVSLNQLASSLKAFELADVSKNDQWLVKALFFGDGAPLEIHSKHGATFISRRDAEVGEVASFPDVLDLHP